MAEIKTKKHHWVATLIVTAISAIISAAGGGIASMMMLMLLWGWLDSSTVGVIQGPPVGFLVGGFTALLLLNKGKSIPRAFFVSTAFAIVISCFIVAILNIDYL